MKVLMLNGSANAKGNTYTALEEIGKQLENEGIEYEIFQIGAEPVRDCIGCGQCTENGCTFTDDKVNAFIAKAKEADGFVFGTPVYYAHPSGRIQAFLDRVFYSSGRAFSFKPGASVAVARRGGTTASFDAVSYTHVLSPEVQRPFLFPPQNILASKPYFSPDSALSAIPQHLVPLHLSLLHAHCSNT